MIGFIVDLVLEVLFHRLTPWRFAGYGVVLILVAIGANLLGGVVLATIAFFGLLAVILAAEILAHMNSAEPTQEADAPAPVETSREPPRS